MKTDARRDDTPPPNDVTRERMSEDFELWKSALDGLLLAKLLAASVALVDDGKAGYALYQATLWTAFVITSLNGYDLLDAWRTAQGVVLMPPDITIARIHLKLSITYTETALQANNGVLIAVGTVDGSDITGAGGTVSSPVAQPYDLDYMWWEQLYTTEQVLNTGVTTNLVFHRVMDIKSRRKLRGQGETLTLQIAGTGVVTLTQVSFTGQILMMLPH